jgi:signal transduction histidine kinase
MKLAHFIRTNIEAISAEWENYASSILPEEEFTTSALRDGIVDILTEIAKDMDSVQNRAEQHEKSIGLQIRRDSSDNAAEAHALARVKMGMSSHQFISEFRALRASVLRLWQDSTDQITKDDLYDVTRFNEAIDQTLSDAESRYALKTEQSRELFLGILGHDLRNPLGAILGLAELIIRSHAPDRTAQFAGQILVSAGRMSHMITDLIELTRVRLGEGIVVSRTAIDIQDVCNGVANEMKAIYPDRTFEVIVDANLKGQWDGPRLIQVLSNLVGNAIQHGGRDTPITIKACRRDGCMELSVHNDGPLIPSHLIPTLFDRFVQGKAGKQPENEVPTNLGLGLYIAKEIVVAHGGTILALSTPEEGTNFIAKLPLAS